MVCGDRLVNRVGYDQMILKERNGKMNVTSHELI